MPEHPFHVLDIVDDYFHEVLSPAKARALEQHADGCAICKAALDEARKRFAALETVPAMEASGELIQATLSRIDRYEQSRRIRRRFFFRIALPALAASILVLSLVHAYYLNLKPTPFDLAVYGQAELMAGSPGSLRIRLTNHETGAAMEGVPVEIELRDKANQVIHLASFTTNAEGSGQPRFHLPDTADGDFQLRVIARPKGTEEVLQEAIKLKRSWKVMLTTDKPVYQPEQTIHVRALALRRPDLKPVAGQDVTFLIADPKGNIIFKRQDVSSRFGITAVDCPLAQEIQEGAYAITCKLGDTESKTTVEVRKYVLPKFKIGIELDQPYYQPGQTIHGKVQANYFFGKPVPDGAVDIEVRTVGTVSTVFRLPPARTSAAGEAGFSFKLPDTLVGIETEGSDARVALQVTLTDTAGQKQLKTISRTVTAMPLRIEVIPEADRLMRDVSNRIYCYVSYADGRPAQAQLAVSGLEKELTTNALGVAFFELTPSWEEKALTLKATDAQGRIGRRAVRLVCGQAGADFLVRTDKAVYNGGDTIQLTALGQGVEPIFVDLLKDDQTVLTHSLEPSGNNATFQLDLPPELFGTIKLSAYRFGPTGLAVRKTRILYVRPAQQLSIQAKLDRDEYRPGKKAKLDLALTDTAGKPTAGALSLTAVDEAVFSVLDQAPGMERTFYLLEQQLLKPVYAIYPWAPDLEVATPPERNQFEQALFARTAMTDSQTGPGDLSAASRLFTMADSSFPTKVLEVKHRRETRLEQVTFAWSMLGLGVAFVVYAAVWLFLRPLWIVFVLHVIAFVVLVQFSLMWVRQTDRAGAAPRMGFAEPQEATAEHKNFVDAFQPRAEDKSAAPPPRPAPMSPAAQPPAPKEAAAPEPVPVAVREWFPETLLWRPEVITDNQGHANVEIDLADSITTWRLTASAVSGDGQLGVLQAPIRVFQPFFVDLNLPVALTRGDEVAIPVVVYNYLDKPQTVELTLTDGAWFERQGDTVQRLELPAGATRSAAYRIRVVKVGKQELQVTARASGVADALKKPIDVIPDGRRVEQVANGTLQQPLELTLMVPEQAIDGSAKAIVKLYPSTFSQVVEGLDGIFRMPSGCFEQTSSTTYPNVLALDYLRRMNKQAPDVEARARQYIHLGYQRLIGFEVAGGGFDWFGRPPANTTLTAYGLMEFQDMARVHDVDPRLIARTREWLLSKRSLNGSWPPEGQGLHEDPTRSRGELARLGATAYIAWAVFSDPGSRSLAGVTVDYLVKHEPSTIADPYILALVANALLALDPTGKHAQAYLDHLETLKHADANGKLCWWEQPATSRTTFYGSGRAGSIETTALATLAFVQAKKYPGSALGALDWLIQQKDAGGTWYSTQATVLALKALLAGTGANLDGGTERRFAISWDSKELPPVIIPPDQAEVMQQLDLSTKLDPGQHRLTIRDLSDAGTGYQVAFRYHVPDENRRDNLEPLAIELTYDRAELSVGETLTATATVTNQMKTVAPMVLLDLPIPPGFAPVSEDFTGLVRSGAIAKFQMTQRSVIAYLRVLEPGKPLRLVYHLEATMPVKVAVPAARVSEYYDTDKKGLSKTSRLTVNAR
jgi:hypothetical protein